LLPVGYLVMPNLLTNRRNLCKSDWLSLLVWRKIMYAARTGQRPR
jgi:hypothetical protein